MHVNVQSCTCGMSRGFGGMLAHRLQLRLRRQLSEGPADHRGAVVRRAPRQEPGALVPDGEGESESRHRASGWPRVTRIHIPRRTAPAPPRPPPAALARRTAPTSATRA